MGNRTTSTAPWSFSRDVLAGLAIATSVLAQSSGGDFELNPSTIDAGGGTAIGGGFELSGTIAQPEADPRPAAGGEFSLAGGFWANAEDTLFSDGFEGN